MSAKHYAPSMKATLPGALSSKVVGLMFAPNGEYPMNLRTLNQLVEMDRPPVLALVRDAGNQFDPNAVAVRSAATGRHLGHLPAALAARIAPEVDRWAVESYEVLVAPGHEDNPGLSLKLRRRP